MSETLKAPLTGNTVIDRFFKDLVTWAADKAARLTALDRAEVKVVTAADHVMTSEDHVEYNGTGGHKITLPLANSLGGRRARPRYVSNNGTGTVTLVANSGPDGANTVEGAGTVEIPTGGSVVLNPNGALKWRAAASVALGVLRTLYNGTNGAPGGVSIVGANAPNNRNLFSIETALGKILEVRSSTSTIFASNIFLRSATIVSSGSLTVSDADHAGVVKIGNTGAVHLRTTAAGSGLTIGDHANEKIGKWGVTPVVQPVMATGTGKTVDDLITMLQSNGDCRQS